MAEHWLEVDSDVDVVDGTGKLIGRLRAGAQYRAVDISDAWVTVPGPDDSFGFVNRSAVRLIDTAQAHTPSTAPTPTHRPGASRPWVIPAAVIAIIAMGAIALALSLSRDDDPDLATQDEPDIQPIDDDPDNQPAQTTESPEPTQPAEDSPPAQETQPSADDLSGGALPFRVVDAGRVDGSSGFIAVGFSAQFAFGAAVAVAGTDGIEIPSELIVIDRATRTESTRIPLGEDYEHLASTLDRGTEVWLGLANDRRILVFDVECLCVTGEIPVGTVSVHWMADVEGQILIPDYDRDARRTVVSVMDPATGGIVDRIDTTEAGAGTVGLQTPLVFGRELWSADSERLWQIRTFDTVDPTEVLELEGRALSAPVAGADRQLVFLTDTSLGLLHVVGRAGFSVRTIQLTEPDDDTFSIEAVTSSPVVDDTGLVWVSAATQRDSGWVLVALDPVTLAEVYRLAFDGPVGQPLATQGHVWLPMEGSIAVVDPATGQIIVDLPAPAGPGTSRIDVVDNELWIQPPFSREAQRVYLIEAR